MPLPRNLESSYQTTPIILLVILVAASAFLLLSGAETSWFDLILPLFFFVAFFANSIIVAVLIRRRSETQLHGITNSILLLFGVVISYAEAYRYTGLAGAETVSDYLYFSVVTFTTLGYGDFVPTGLNRLIAASEALIGFLFAPVFVAQLVAAMATTDTSPPSTSEAHE
ncbi:MAG: potassium channel family protein [Pseudomonadota bacterium]